MTLPVPNLDDRTYDQIIAEAIRRIPKYCPDWTDHNPSDPGVTLIELLAWMSEMIIYRLNRVPEKNYIKFLDLMGIDLLPPQPSTAEVTFSVVEGAKEENLIPVSKGTRVATVQTETREAIIFETEKELNLTTSNILKCYSRYGTLFSDHTEHVLDPTQPGTFPVFFGKEETEHILYLGDNDLESLGRDTILRIYIDLLAEHTGRLNLEWEYWNGVGWESAIPETDETRNLRESGYISFTDIYEIQPKEIYGIESFWIRCRLIGAEEGATLPNIGSIKKAMEMKVERGRIPEFGFSNVGGQFLPIDFKKDFYPLGTLPKVNDAFYIGSEEVFSKKDSRITLEIELSEFYSPPPIETVKELQVAWEYYSGETEKWETLGITTATGVKVSEHAFNDTTNALTQDGNVTFNIPPDIASSEIQGQDTFWIRVRIIAGDYGKEEGVTAPSIKSILLRFSQKLTSFPHCLTYNDFLYRNIGKELEEEKIISFMPFEIIPEKSPTIYIGFDKAFTNTLHRIHFRVTDSEIDEYGNEDRVIVWEYWSKEKNDWTTLNLVTDTTENFTKRGGIEFVGPIDFAATNLFESDAYWIRGRWEIGRYEYPPHLAGISLNTMSVIQAISLEEEILGSSNGSPNQVFDFSQSPILPGPEIVICELENPSEQEINKFKEDLGEDVIEETDEETGEIIALWVRWHEVKNFFDSGPESRHYVLDRYTGQIFFGDGRRGKIPPIGKSNVKCSIYYVGGGTIGNVGKNTISVLESSIPYVESVINLDPAGGGADAETIEDAKLRGPSVLKHRYRAVTMEDFERLALESSKNVARVRCIPTERKEGEVTVIVVPKSEEDRPVPSAQLLRRAESYLDERRLITTELRVVKPDYVPVSIRTDVVITKFERAAEIKRKIEEEIRKFLHPLKGGPDWKGWPFGRDVFISEIYALLEGLIEELDYVSTVILNHDPRLQRVTVGKNSLVYPKEIKINIVTE